MLFTVSFTGRFWRKTHSSLVLKTLTKKIRETWKLESTIADGGLMIWYGEIGPWIFHCVIISGWVKPYPAVWFLGAALAGSARLLLLLLGLYRQGGKSFNESRRLEGKFDFQFFNLLHKNGKYTVNLLLLLGLYSVQARGQGLQSSRRLEGKFDFQYFNMLHKIGKYTVL